MSIPVTLPQQTHRFCVAPMMEWTDRHCRFFHRLLTRHTLLYTEMITADAIIHGPRQRLLAFDPAEHPVALQLGGSNPKNLAKAALIGAEFGYSEINLNVGCPSDRVQEGRFGACLMREPKLVGECVVAMKARVSIDVLADTIHAFPSTSRILNGLFADALRELDAPTNLARSGDQPRS